MNTTEIFDRTLVTLSQSFLKVIPASIDKPQFFKDSCVGLKCTVIGDGENEAYSLEGVWEAVVNAHRVLLSRLSTWDSFEKRAVDQSHNYLCKESRTEHNACPLSSGEKKTTDVVESEEHFVCKNEIITESSAEDLQENFGASHLTKIIGCPPSHPLKAFAQEKKYDEVDNTRRVTEEKRRFHSAATISETPKTVTENEMYLDIQLEHNYNHCKSTESTENYSESGEPSIENEIYMDIQLSKPNDEIFADPTLPVTLVIAKEDEAGVEVLQLNRNRNDLVSSQNVSQREERIRLLKKRYEDQAPFRYFCNQCSFKTKRHSHMKNHSRLHERVCTIYSCDKCDFSTIRSSHFQRHLGSHQEEMFSCTDCAYTTHNKALLTKHQRYKHILSKNMDEVGTFQCLLCAYSTPSAKIFRRHTAVHAKKGGRVKKSSYYKCSDCSYQSPSRSNFYRHRIVHGNERPYMCTTCGLCFKRSDTLVQHQSTHLMKESEESPMCHVCKKCFRSVSALKEHQLTHADEQRYLCEVCAASFKTRDSQRRHFNQKHGTGRINSCPTCSKNFSSRYILRRHMRLHDQQRKQADHGSPLMATSIQHNSKEWHSPTDPTQLSDGVQVIVVHHEPAHSDVSVQDGPLFQVASSLLPGQTLSVPVIPMEYVIPATDAESDKCNVNVPLQPSREEIIALTFVQRDSEFVDQNPSSV